MAKNPRHSNTGIKVILILLILAMIAATGFVIWLCIDLVNQSPDASISTDIPITLPTDAVPETTETVPPTTLPPEPEHVVSTATISAMGDLLMHLPVINEYDQPDGTYNFDRMFRYISEYSSASDYSAINLETTLYGPGKPYHGFPMFNCPDAIAEGAFNAGFDMMLTANNHSYDTGIAGYNRTLEVCREVGFTTLGTMMSSDEPKYEIVDVNGIKIGMVCYTYETSNGSNSYPSLNGNPMYDGSYDVINCFMPSYPQRFYEEVEGYLQEMKENGAEATMIYIHWGVEYQTYANDNQKAIAQKLCDIGFDVIIGGHPHVVQPVDLLQSTVDKDHRTVVIYSLGNAVSNQRQAFGNSFASGHTEDGVMFSVTFEKYSDGTVYLADADVLPTWVNMHTTDGVKNYDILPLDNSILDQWQEKFSLSDAMLASAHKSYDRTIAIVGEGLKECQEYLAQQKLAREEYYYNLAFFPEMFAATPTETNTPEETTLPNAA